MLDDPRVNFAMSPYCGETAGVSHLGIQAEDETEFGEVYERLARDERPIFDEKAVTCCYSNSDKQWIADPQGVHWETFFSYGESTVYGLRGASQELEKVTARVVCCEPEAKTASACCAG